MTRYKYMLFPPESIEIFLFVAFILAFGWETLI